MFRFPLTESAEMRLFEVRHADELYNLCDRNRERLAPYLPWIHFTHSAADTRAFIENALQQFASNEGFHAGIWSDGKLAGSVGMHRIDRTNRSSSIGYWIGAEFEGRGLVTRGAGAFTDFALGTLGLHRVEIRCATDNHRSKAVAERLGYKQEGILRGAQYVAGRWLDQYVFSKIAGEA